WRFDQSLEGFEATGASSWAPALPSEVTSPLGRRDVIVVRGVEGSDTTVLSHVSASADLGVELNSNFGKELQNYFGKSNPKSPFIVLVSNCQNAAVFQV